MSALDNVLLVDMKNNYAWRGAPGYLNWPQYNVPLGNNNEQKSEPLNANGQTNLQTPQPHLPNAPTNGSTTTTHVPPIPVPSGGIPYKSPEYVYHQAGQQPYSYYGPYPPVTAIQSASPYALAPGGYRVAKAGEWNASVASPGVPKTHLPPPGAHGGLYNYTPHALGLPVGMVPATHTRATTPVLYDPSTITRYLEAAKKRQVEVENEAAVERYLATLPSRRKKRFKYSSTSTPVRSTESKEANKPSESATTKNVSSTKNDKCVPTIGSKKTDSKDNEGANSKKVKKPACRQSKYRGVCWNKSNGSWKACLKVEGRNVHIGYFDDELDAAKAYDAKAYSIRGSEAKLNFPRGSLPYK